MTSEGVDGITRPFEKPLTTTLLMFIAMALALPAHFIHQYYFLHHHDHHHYTYQRYRFSPKVGR